MDTACTWRSRAPRNSSRCSPKRRKRPPCSHEQPEFPSPAGGGGGGWGRMRVGVLGATGLAGQQVLAALERHPWFTVAAVGASESSAGKSFGDALREPSGASRWFADGRADPSVLSLPCLNDEQLLAQPLDLVFSAVSKEVAEVWEPRFAERVPVISTASAFRYEPDVPILIPGINDAHAEAIHDQRRKRGWRGFIAPIPNCTTTGLAVSLKPLHDAFGVRTVMMTSLQAVSGAGRQGGVLALDVVDNVIPFIPGEEEKVERETKKILGHWGEPAPFAVSCTCTRVNVTDGHLEAVFVGTDRPAAHRAASGARRRVSRPASGRAMTSSSWSAPWVIRPTAYSRSHRESRRNRLHASSTSCSRRAKASLRR